MAEAAQVTAQASLIRLGIASRLSPEPGPSVPLGKITAQTAGERRETDNEPPKIAGSCDAIMGIIEEGQEVTKEFKGAPALDAGLLAAAQAVEHYEIARYGTLKTWAAELGLNQAVKLLETTLGEEKKTDETLTKLAQSEVNQHAQAA